MSKQWEYYSDWSGKVLDDEALNKLGEQGWELVKVPTPGDGRYLFKREKEATN